MSKNLLSVCTTSDDIRCTPELINKATSLERDNAATWLKASIYFVDKGDDIHVMESITQLSKALFFKERIGEEANAFAQALSGTEANAYIENAFTGYGKALGNMPSFLPLINWCKNGQHVQDKANACLNLGEQLQERGQTKLTKVMGIALQNIIYEEQQNTTNLQLLEQTKTKLMALAGEDTKTASLMMFLDERLLRSWLHNFDAFGETDSHQMMVEEAKILYQDNENYVCNLTYDLVNSLK